MAFNERQRKEGDKAFHGSLYLVQISLLKSVLACIHVNKKTGFYIVS